MHTTLTRYKPCVLCSEYPAVTPGGACKRCHEDVDWRDRYEFAVDNEATCGVCGGFLSRCGYCWSCLDASWKPVAR